VGKETPINFRHQPPRYVTLSRRGCNEELRSTENIRAIQKLIVD
jgi:hypothetical protein